MRYDVVNLFLLGMKLQALFLLWLGATLWSFTETAEIKCTVTFSFLSWNVNGVKKFEYLPAETRYLRSHDVVFLQETFSREDLELLELKGFYSHHLKAKPSIRGRNHWGVSSFFRHDAFKNGTLES